MLHRVVFLRRIERTPMRRLFLTLVAMAVSASCAFDWDQLDPRGATGVGGGGTGAGGTQSAGGAGGTGDVGGAGGRGGAGGSGGSAGVGGSGGEGGGVVFGPWSTPVLVPNINDLTADDDDPSFTADLLELYFNSERGADSNVWMSKRATIADPWGTPEPVVEVNTASLDGNPVVAPDGLSLWLSTRRDGQPPTDRDIYVSTRPDRTSAWSVPVREAALSALDVHEYAGSVTADSLTFLLERNHDLYVATRLTTGSPWSIPVPIAELNTSDDEERQAWISHDGNTLYFDTNGGLSVDIVMTTRASSAAPWQTPISVTELNTDEDESDAWLSGDQRFIMFTKNDSGIANIYQSSR